MKKSDYLLWKNRIENSYAAFLAEREADYLPERKESLPADYCMAARPDGRLHENAESLIVAWIKEKSYPDFIYCDEDRLNAETGERSAPFLKPDWSPETLESFFYPGGLVVLKQTLVARAERETGRKADLDSVDFLYECAVRAETVSHLPLILYHSFSAPDYQYGRKRNPDLINTDKISAVILSKDNPDMLGRCIRSLQAFGGEELEIIVVDNGSSRENTEKTEALSDELGFCYRRSPMEFVYSALCNIGASAASGRFLLFLNDDVEVPCENGFLGKMKALAAKPQVGAVGIKLLYPDSDLIQHVGITDLAVGPSHKLATFPDSEEYYFGRNRVTYNMLAVTGACLMVEKQKFDAVGGFDERLFVAYTDVDLCVDLLEKGFRSVVVNDVFLYHHESVSRGNDILSREKRQRLDRERSLFYGKHPFLKEKGDPFYHRDLTPWKLEYEPDILMPWEEPEWRSKPIEGRRLMRAGAKIFASIDAVGRRSGMQGDYYEVEGWIFRQGRRGLLYEPGIVLSADGHQSRYTAVRRFRRELPEVFPGEKQIDLNGFICRIPCEDLHGIRHAQAAACCCPVFAPVCYVKQETGKLLWERQS